MALRSVIPIPTVLIDSPHFLRHEDLQLLHETLGGVLVPLKHNAVLEVISLVATVKASHPQHARMIDEWQNAVLGLTSRPPSNATSPMTSPRESPMALPATVPTDMPPGVFPRCTSLPDMHPLPHTSPREPLRSLSDARCTGLMSPIRCVPEMEPETENHSLFPVVRTRSHPPARFVPVPVNPEVNPQRSRSASRSSFSTASSGTSSGHSSAGSSVSPSRAALSVPHSPSGPTAPSPPVGAGAGAGRHTGRATGYFPLQGAKRRSPLSSPPVLALGGASPNMMGLMMEEPDSVGEHGGAETALVAGYLNAARDFAGLPLAPALLNGTPPDAPALTSASAITALTSPQQAAWTKYYLGKEVTGASATRVLRVCVGLPAGGK